MEKDINQLIIKEFKKRIKKLEDEVIYLRGRLDSLTIPNLNIQQEKYIYPYVTNDVPYSEKCSCNPKNGGSGVCGCILGSNTTVIC